jgi:subtilase family serine protease
MDESSQSVGRCNKALSVEVEMDEVPNNLSPSRHRVTFHLSPNHPILTLLDWLWSGIRWVWVAILLAGLVAGPLFSLLTHGNLGLGDVRTWKVVALATNYPTWSLIVFASVVFITVVSYLAHRTRLSAGRPLVQVPPAISVLVSVLAVAAIVTSALVLPAPRPVSSVCSTPAHPSGTAPPAHSYTPQELQMAYHFATVFAGDTTGKGQTVAIVTSFYMPSLQADFDRFSQEYHLPMAHVDVLAPLGLKAADPSDSTSQSWVGLDVETAELVHAVAPDAHIVVVSSPVAETEGTAGLPEFLTLERYVVEHHVASVIVQPWGASEYTLLDAAGVQEMQQWDAFFQTATVNDNITFIAGTGRTGGTDVASATSSRLLDRPVTGFPASDPWVLAVGGTSLSQADEKGNAQEVAWNRSGGGYSANFPEPVYQQYLPPQVQTQLAHRRGIPDVAATGADPNTGVRIYVGGKWITSVSNGASAAIWGGAIALANQLAGHPLGFINPTLYKLGTSDAASNDFRDITEGTNCFNGIGYPAGPGWDPVTGLGTPIADNLLVDLAFPQ